MLLQAVNFTAYRLIRRTLLFKSQSKCETNLNYYINANSYGSGYPGKLLLANRFVKSSFRRVFLSILVNFRSHSFRSFHFLLTWKSSPSSPRTELSRTDFWLANWLPLPSPPQICNNMADQKTVSIYQNSAWQRGLNETNEGNWMSNLIHFFCLCLEASLSSLLADSSPALSYVSVNVKRGLPLSLSLRASLSRASPINSDK